MLSAIRTLGAVGIAGALVLATAARALAGGVDSQCDPTTQSCTISVTIPGQPPTANPGNPGSGGGSGGGQGGADPSPSPSGSFFSTPCTYRPDPEYQPPAGADPHPTGSGGWYLMTCPDALKPTGVAITSTTVVWLSAPPAVTGPSPAQLAAQAKSLLRLTTPVIGSSPKPGEPDLVGLNLWAWVASSAWSAQSATASAGGLSVTATAIPSYATWDFGDGTVITCQGPGTVYQPSDGENPLSPTCGHDYRESGAFTETVTVHWAVAWAGAGQSGAFNDMTTTASQPVTVEQSQAVVTR